MIEKATYSVFKAYYGAKAKVEKLKNEENGMETLETIIVVAIAVVVAAFIINFLTKGKIGDSEEGQGLIGYMFSQIGAKISDIFKAAPDNSTSGTGTPAAIPS